MFQENKELLGVVGTDVALPQLEDSVPASEVKLFIVLLCRDNGCQKYPSFHSILKA